MRYYLYRQQTLIGRLQNWIAVTFCEHEVSISMIERRGDHVEAECCKCGHRLTAPYGLALPAKLTR